MSSLKILAQEELLEVVIQRASKYSRPYLAMYSSWFGGIVKNPACMLIPIDDHMVHRGDGVFEALKCVNGKLYLFDRHMERLLHSARSIKLDLPVTVDELKNIVIETIRVSGAKDAVVRIFVSRGPGGFSADPLETVGPQIYVVVTEPLTPPKEHYEKGVTVRQSKIPMKPSHIAHIKTCNYLHSVMMSMEAHEMKVDFTVSVDEDGCLGEGPTENIAIITSGYEFLVPKFGKVLRGTTVSRAMELAKDLVKIKVLSRIAEECIPLEEVYRAHEVMMFGTTFDVLPVVRFDDKKIGHGQPGPFYKKLLKLIREDMEKNPSVSIPVF
ncbi:MAG: aminotransferase class IV [Syntrophobacterales bacterium]|nr:aminotransferase class IV [Syntrophobacterales bacterium]